MGLREMITQAREELAGPIVCEKRLTKIFECDTIQTCQRVL